MAKYFSQSRNNDIEFHETEAEARARAAALFEAAQDGEVDVGECRSIMWGEVRETTYLDMWMERPDWIDGVEEDDYTPEQTAIAALCDWRDYDVFLSFELGPIGTPDVPHNEAELSAMC